MAFRSLTLYVALAATTIINSVVLVGLGIMTTNREPPLVVTARSALERESFHPGETVTVTRYVSKVRACQGTVKPWLMGPQTFILDDYPGGLQLGDAGPVRESYRVPADAPPGIYTLRVLIDYDCGPFYPTITVALDEVTFTVLPKD